MKKSLMKLVDVVLQKLQEQPERFSSETGLRSWLANEGYAKRDIDAAIKVVGAHAFKNTTPQSDPLPLRQFSTFETFKLSPQARDALVRLEMYDVIEPMERELILERLEQFEGQVAIEDLDYLVSWVVCSTRDVAHQQTIYNVLHGNGTALN